jgi:hypothetical protein
MPWISIREAPSLIEAKYSVSFRAHQIVERGGKDGCGHPKRFVRGIALGKHEPEIITEPLEDGAYVDTLCARIEGGSWRGVKNYFNVEIHDAKFLAYVAEEGLAWLVWDFARGGNTQGG